MTLDFAAVARALLENALDQVAAGRASAVGVTFTGATVSVRDDGPGLPLGPHPLSGRPLLEVILTGPRRGPRNTLARVNAACLWLEAAVDAGGGHWFQRYEWAVPVAPPERHGDSRTTGSTLLAAPSRGDPPSLQQVVAWIDARRGPRGRVEVEHPDGALDVELAD